MYEPNINRSCPYCNWSIALASKLADSDGRKDKADFEYFYRGRSSLVAIESFRLIGTDWEREDLITRYLCLGCSIGFSPCDVLSFHFSLSNNRQLQKQSPKVLPSIFRCSWLMGY